MNTAVIDHISKENIIDNAVHEPPPSYEELFITPNTSHNVQCQPPSTLSTDNDQYRQPFVNVQLTSSQPIYIVKSHIVWSVLNIIFCCFCFGCIACCFSMRTKNLKKQGDAEGALIASKTARKWNMFTTIFGVIMFFIEMIHFFYTHS